MLKLLTVKEVAEALTLSPFTIKRMLKAGVLPFVRINRNDDEGSNLYPLLFKTIVKKAGGKLSQE